MVVVFIKITIQSKMMIYCRRTSLRELAIQENLFMISYLLAVALSRASVSILKNDFIRNIHLGRSFFNVGGYDRVVG